MASYSLCDIEDLLIFLDFHLTKRDFHWLILVVTWPWLNSNVSRPWYIKQCSPLGIHYSTWSKHGGKWGDRRREKPTLPVFVFVNEHNNTNTKPQAKKQWFLKLSQKFPEEKQQLVEEKDADNIRKVLCKSFIQWFWELNLCCYKYRVDCFGSLRLFFCCCWSESLEI